MVLLLITICLIFPTLISTQSEPSYIVGLAYYELGDENVTIDVPSSVPQNTALIITLYDAYHPGFRLHYDANIEIAGEGRSHIKTIIWSTFKSTLHFKSDAATKRLSYQGYKNTSANQVALSEFDRSPHVILHGYASPVKINIPSTDTSMPPSYIVGLAYYELGDENVTINVPSSISQNTALIITLYEAYHPGFRQQYDANVDIAGTGRSHIKTIIWSTYKSTLHFKSDAATKRLSYQGYKNTSANQVALSEFDRSPHVILHGYASPVKINIPSTDKAFGTLELIHQNISGVVGEQLLLQWKLTFYNGALESSSSFQICLEITYKNCLVSGTGHKFSQLPNTVFGDRIEAKYDGDMHNLIINNLSINDHGRKLFVRAIFSKLSVEKQTLTIQVNARPKVLKSLASKLFFEEGIAPVLHVIASGIPRPTVIWKFRDQIIEGSHTNNSIHEYKYMVKMPSLTRQLCGYKLHYSISGWNNSILTETAIVIVNFTPEKPAVTVTKTNEENIVVFWKEVNYGLCSVDYRVNVFDDRLMVLKSIQTKKVSVELSFNSEEERRNATIVKVTTSFLGTESSSVRNITYVSPTQTTTPTRNETAAGSNERTDTEFIIGASVGGLVVGVILGVIITCILGRRKKNRSKGGNKESALQSPYYNDIIVHGTIMNSTDMPGMMSMESNYATLNMSNVQTSSYMELQSSHDKDIGQPHYEIMPTWR